MGDLFALVEGNNFYVSCERVFQPELRGRPVVVLSNNHGCVIARSNEAKALGIAMGAPWHLHRTQFESAGVIVRSSNYTFYGDMSARVMNVLAGFAPELEIYSIDEAFLGMSGFGDRLEQHARTPCARRSCNGGRTFDALSLATHCWMSSNRLGVSCVKEPPPPSDPLETTPTTCGPDDPSTQTGPPLEPCHLQ